MFGIGRKSVQLDLLLTMEELILKNLSPVSKTGEKNLTEPERVRLLVEAGFTSAPEVIKYQKQVESQLKGRRLEEAIREDVLKSFKVLLKARKVYGNSTLLIPVSQFMEICKKHKLTCGGLDEFIGEIPDDKLQEIVELQQKTVIDEIIPLRSVYKATFTGSGGRSSREEREEVLKHLSDDFPFLRKSRSGYHVTFADGHEMTCSFMEFDCGKMTPFFMCAPEKMFSERKKIQHVWDKSRDPFMCSLTKYGILIFTRWGEEANDKTIKAYEDLDRKISEYEQKLFP